MVGIPPIYGDEWGMVYDIAIPTRRTPMPCDAVDLLGDGKLLKKVPALLVASNASLLGVSDNMGPQIIGFPSKNGTISGPNMKGHDI